MTNAPAKNKNKLDVAQVIKLRNVNKLSFGKIADITGCTRQSVHRAYHKFIDVLQDTDITETFESNRANILTSIEMSLLQDLCDAEKRKKASLNNVAFAYSKVNDARRLEQGKSASGGVTVTIEIAYQQAQDLATKARLKHAGSSVSSKDRDEISA